MRLTEDTAVRFDVSKLLKTSRPGKHQGHLVFNA